MRKTLAICGLAVAAAGMIYAASDKINIFRSGILTHSINIDELDNISYEKDASGNGFSQMKANFKNGNVATFDIDDVQGMEYTAGRPDNPVTVEVIPHHMCATLSVTSPDDDEMYRFHGVPVSQLASYDESVWAQKLFDADLEFLQDVAGSYGRPLDSFDPDEMFFHGSQMLDWFPSETIPAGEEIALVVYTGYAEGNDVVLTSEPKLIRFNCKQLVDEGVRFDVTADMTSTTLTVKADAIGGSDIPFSIQLYSPEEVAENGLQYLVGVSLSNLEQMVYRYGMSWDDVTYRVHGERTYTNRRTGDSWVAVVFGCEYGVATTDATVEVFEIPMAEVTDDCTFETSVTQLSASEMQVEVVPSNETTRWTTLFVESSKLGEEENAAEMYVANSVYWINALNTLSWTDSKMVHSGSSTLNTHDDMIDGAYMQVGTEYTALIFGVDEVGTRTTAIKKVTLQTQSEVSGDLTFEVEPGNFDDSQMYTHYLEVTVTPSDQEKKYVFEHLPADNAYAKLDCSDEEFMQRYVDVQGEWLTLRQGTLTRMLPFAKSYTSTGNWGDYVIMIFGYDGEITSELYLYKVDGGTGEMTQLRGPGITPAE